MVSMKDIANHLHISRCTVSNILNNRFEGKSYRKETIDLVRNTAKEMGYVSNSMARALKTGASGTIAIVVPDIANTFYIKIIKEVERLANERGYSLIICMAEEIIEKENAALTMLQSRCVDGVLVSPVSYSHSLLNEYPFKIVCFDRTVAGNRFCDVLIDNYAAGYKLAEAMIHDGARKPLFIAGSMQDYTVVHRYRGFCDAMRDHSLTFDFSPLLVGLYNEEQAYEAVRKAVGDNLSFDSVFLCTNYIFYGVARALRECNREDTFLGGMEEFSGMQLFNKDLRVLCQPESEIGRVAFEKLIELLEGKHPDSAVLETRLYSF